MAEDFRQAINPQEDSVILYSITIHEGRKRQVRRMFEELGYQAFALRQVRIGKLALGALGEGEVRQLSADEIESLRSCPKKSQRQPLTNS